MSSPIAVSFPQELRSSIDMNQSPGERIVHISDILVQKATRDQFISWAEQHKDFVSSSPMMQQIVDKVVEYEQKESTEGFTSWVAKHGDLIASLPLSQTIQKIAAHNPVKQTQPSEAKMHLCEGIEKGEAPEQVTPEFVSMLTEYFKIGSLPYSKLKEILSAQKIFADMNYSPSASKSNFSQFELYTPLLKELSPEQLINLLEVRCFEDLGALLRSGYIFSLHLGVLKELSVSQLKSILTLRYETGPETGNLIINRNTMGSLSPLLEKFSIEEKDELMATQNRDGTRPFLALWGDEKSAPLLNAMPLADLKKLLLMHNRAIPIELWKNLVPRLKTMQDEELNELFSVVPFDFKFFPGAKAFLNSTDFNRQLQFRDKQGNTFLHSEDLPSEESGALLNNIQFEELNTILQIQNKQGLTPLQTRGGLRHIVPLMHDKLDADQLEKLFLSQLSLGNNLFIPYKEDFTEGNLVITLLFARKLPQEKFLALLSASHPKGHSLLKDDSGVVPLIFITFFLEGKKELVKPIAEKLPLDLLCNNLCHICHTLSPSKALYPHVIETGLVGVIEILSPFISQFSSEQLTRLMMSSENEMSVTTLQIITPVAVKFFIPLLLEKCSSKELAEMLLKSYPHPKSIPPELRPLKKKPLLNS